MMFDEPFTSIHHEGITGQFDNDMAIKLVSVIRELNESVRISS
jgi:type I restriction enzyme, R subunit